MKADSIYFKGHLCFKTEWAGFDTIKPINVIIGRNNSGKSHLLDLVEALSKGQESDRGWQCRYRGLLDEVSLRSVFNEKTGGGSLGGNHWNDHGRHFVNTEVTWETDTNGNCTEVVFPSDFKEVSRWGQNTNNARIMAIKGAVRNPTHELNGTQFRVLLADRDIRSEPSDNKLELRSDGTGASNIIRRFITTSNEQLPREIIQEELLYALNSVFRNDGVFTEIQVQEHDDETAEGPKGHWEVYLGEEQKGLISLSKSGSGLKTILLVLLNLLVVPRIDSREKSEYIFAFEELENNLHPALMRRLLQYLEDYVNTEQATIFLTTHSSTALDVFGVSEYAQIIHVTHDGETARTSTVSEQLDRLAVISKLGAKPSDLLQANGIVWVEGPSDRVYLNRWIQLYSNGDIREGRDYQCAFYGGSLLAQIEFKPSDDETLLTNLFRVNPNIVVVCDGDRESKDANPKYRVQRIYNDVYDIPNAHIWITEAREIENYIPGSVLGVALKVDLTRDPEQYELFFSRSDSKSYFHDQLKRKHVDKMDLAMISTPHMTKDNMAERFDWEEHMKVITERILSWNA